MIALLTREAFQMVDIVPGSHHHFKCWNDFVARSAHASIPEQSARKMRKQVRKAIYARQWFEYGLQIDMIAVSNEVWIMSHSVSAWHGQLGLSVADVMNSLRIKIRRLKYYSPQLITNIVFYWRRSGCQSGPRKWELNVSLNRMEIPCSIPGCQCA